jgi:hypothetical protein
VTFTVDTKWKLTPELKALGAVNSALDAADVTAATTSDSKYAAIAVSEGNTVELPWGADDAISVKSTGRGDLGVTLPTAQPRGVNVNGNVVYHNPDGPVDTVAQPTVEGGASIFQVIEDAKAPRDVVEFRDNLIDRILVAEREGRLGEIEGLQVSLSGTEDSWLNLMLPLLTSNRLSAWACRPSQTSPPAPHPVPSAGKWLRLRYTSHPWATHPKRRGPGVMYRGRVIVPGVTGSNRNPFPSVSILR